MSSGSLALRAAIIAAVKADSDLAALGVAQVYDSVPDGVVFPFVSFGPEMSGPWEATCLDGADTALQLDVWSRAVGSVEALRIADALRTTLHRQSLSLSGQALTVLTVDACQVMRDPDGKTTHAILRLRALTERTSP